MGYMGFGMQRWIYSRSPRKLFVKDRIPSFSPLQKYYRTFSIKKRVVINKRLAGLYSILVATGFILVMIFSFNNFKNYSNTQTKEVSNLIKLEDKKAFVFLVRSGKNRLAENRIKDAYYEFHLAHKIYPKSENLNKLLVETLSILCIDNNNYCKEIDTLFLN